MTSTEIRYLNVRKLVADFGGVSALADKLNKTQAQVSAFAGEKPRKGIGNKVARDIETTFDLPRGWMDVLHGSTEQLIEIIESLPPEYQEMVKAFVSTLRSQQETKGTQ